MFQENAVYFHLYTTIVAESVVVMTKNNLPIQLDQGCNGNEQYWTNQQPFYLPDDQKDFRYHYKATFQKSVVKRVLHWISRSGDGSNETITEKGFRKLNSGTYQYDVFRFPGKMESDQDLFAGYLCFVDMLYGKIQVGRRNNFPEILIECENVHLSFQQIDKADIQKFLKWIEQVISKESTWHYAVFICSILGQMVKQLKIHGKIFDRMSPKIANQLLNLLKACEYDHIPQSSVEMIKSVAEDLYKAGRQRGWLSFLSYFANLLEVDRLLETADTLPMDYSDEDFDNLADFVIDMLKSLEVSESSKICDFVVSKCRSICCLWHLHRKLSVHVPGVTNALGERFSDRFCKLISCRTRAKKIDLLQVNYWEMIPNELRVKLAEPFIEALHQQIEHGTLSKESLDTLRSYIADKGICASKPFPAFIRCLTRKRNEDVVETVIYMLNSKGFFVTWKSWSHSEKSDTCTSLLETMFQFQNRFGRRTFQDKHLKVIEVLEAEKKIGETAAVQSDQQIKLALEECVIKLLQTVSINSVFAAYDGMDTSSQIMQSCYSSLLRDAVKRTGTSGDTSHIKMFLRILDDKKMHYQTAEFEG